MAEQLYDQLNRPLNDLRISLTDRCQFRCNYCLPITHTDVMRQQDQRNDSLSFEEIAQVTKVFAELGVHKVRLTGGEPLLRKNLGDLIRQLKTIDGIDDLALTTNGALLPTQLKPLIDAGLDRITISLDAVEQSLFTKITGTQYKVQAIIDTILQCAASSLKAIKVNCVVQKGVNEQQVLPLLETFKETRVEVRFIEYMDVGNINGWNLNQVNTTAETLALIKASRTFKPLKKSTTSQVAEVYRLDDDHSIFGTISSISKPFCQDCNRARLSAKGTIYTCLFSNQGHDIKNCAASPEKLKNRIKAIWQQRNDRYSELRSNNKTDTNQRIEMFVMGG